MFFNTLINYIEKLGKFTIRLLENFGAACIFVFKGWFQVFFPPYRPHLIMVQILQIGVNSSLVIGLIGFFTGAVLAVQGEYTLNQFGATAYTGSMVALSLIRELGPVLTALMVIGRAGSAITAELGIMKITEQIDALKSMAVDPIKYLISPRLLAGIISVPLLTILFIVIGIFGGYAVGVGLLGLSSGTFVTQMQASVKMIDLYSGVVKAIVFGFIFGWVSTYKGVTCGFGAVGVNKATTRAVVTASVAILVVDYFLSSILTRIFLD